jgi:6-phosphogluconolactonase (cycloisomerase 2 family)
VAVGLCPDSLAIDGSSRFLFVGNECDNTISGFTINTANGLLTPILGSPFVARPTPPANPGKTPQGLHVAIMPSGQFLFSADVTNNAIEAFSVNQAIGTLTRIGTFPGQGSSCPFASAVDRTGRFLFVSDFCSAVITAYAIQPTGVLTPVAGSPFTFFPMGAPVRDIKVDPGNSFVFTADSENNNVTAWTIGSTGTLTLVPGSPFPAGTAPFAIAVSP